MPYREIEEARLPLIITVIDLGTGRTVFLHRRALIPALMASCAVPGIFPPVMIDGVQMVDGGLGADARIAPLAESGIDRVYSCRRWGRPAPDGREGRAMSPSVR